MKMTDDEFRSAIEEEVTQADTWAQSNIREEQERNLRYYLGMPLGNEIDGRSQVVSWDVFEIVESAMPSFIEPFFSGDHIGEYQPRGPEDEAYADQATDVANYIIKDRNDGFLLFETWFKDALISKIGIVRGEWEQEEPKRVELENLDDGQMQMLVQEEQSGRIEIIEHDAKAVQLSPQEQQQFQQMGQQAAMQGQPGPQLPATHNVTLLQKVDGCVKLENVRPENFVVSRGAKTTAKARLVGEFVTYTRSDLKEMGLPHADDVSDFAVGASVRSSSVQSLRDDDSIPMGAENAPDPSMEEIILFRGFIRCDRNGDGIAEYRRVLVGGNHVLVDEEAEWQDYCVITPIPLPHRVVGMAYADPAAEIQRLNTTLTRQYLDSLYAANNPRTYVNMDARVNLDDMLNNRINGLVRGHGPGQNAVMPLQTTLVARDALEGLQMGQSMRERRLGITAYNQGLDADALNKTATGVQKIMNAADKRQLMTLRIMAETGVKQLFKLVLKIITKYQDKPGTIRLRNEWVSYDPRGWNADMDVTIDVGIGSGDKTETLLFLREFGMFMGAAKQEGIVTPENTYEFGKFMAKLGKIKNSTDRLLTDPAKQGQKPPQVPPEVQAEQMKQQAEAQKFQAQAQLDSQKAEKDHQFQLQLEQFKANAQMGMERERIASAERIAAQKIQSEEKRELLTLSSGLLAAKAQAAAGAASGADGESPKNLINGTNLDQTSQDADLSGASVSAAAGAIQGLADSFATKAPE